MYSLFIYLFVSLCLFIFVLGHSPVSIFIVSIVLFIFLPVPRHGFGTRPRAKLVTIGALESAALAPLFDGPIVAKAVGFEGKAGFIEEQGPVASPYPAQCRVVYLHAPRVALHHPRIKT